MEQKKRYHVVRKNKADTRALFRALLCGYLLYLAWQLIQSGGSDPSFTPLVAWLLGGLFILAAAEIRLTKEEVKWLNLEN